MLIGNVSSFAIYENLNKRTQLTWNPAGEGGGAAMARIYGNIGFKGLWNGLPVRIGMVRFLFSLLEPLDLTDKL